MHTTLWALLRSLIRPALLLAAPLFLPMTAPLSAAAGTGPVISAAISPATLPVTGGVITVTATITDPGGQAITNVYANVAHLGNVTLNNGGIGNVYTATFASDGNNTGLSPEVYTATVTASDASSSSTAAATGQTVQANDDTPPTITHTAISPSTLPVTGGMITVTATVTDPSGRAVNNVYTSVAHLGHFSLSNGGIGNVYTATFASDGNNTDLSPEVYTATVTATNDLSLSNSATVTGQTVQANDDTPPTITNATITPAALPFTGGVITVTATVTDPGGRAVNNVYTDISHVGHVALSNGGFGNVYTGNFGVGSNTGGVPIVYTAIVTAINDLGLSNRAVTNGQTGQGNSGPPASLVPLLLTSDPSKPILSPAYVPAGSPDTALTITGVNFAADALVSINGVELAASLITKATATQITVTVPAVLLVNPGALAVGVISPSLGSLSNPVNLNVLGAEDVTTLVALNYLGQRYDRASGTYLRSYLLTNKGGRFLPGALSLVADRLTNARLSNAVGITRYKKPAGSPFVMVAAAGLAPGASATATLALAATGAGPVTYTPRILAGIGAR